MGCFLACFGGAKERRRRKHINRIPPREGEKLPEHRRLLRPSSPPKQLRRSPLKPPQGPELLSGEASAPGSQLELRDTSEEWTPALKPPPQDKSPIPVLELRDKSEKSSFSSPRKKVTFDLNVKTYEEAPIGDDAIYSSQELAEEEKSDENKTHVEGSSIPVGLGASTLNRRYQNCMISDEEDVEDDGEDDYDYISEEDDCDEEDHFEDCEFHCNKNALDGRVKEEEESYESYFSLPLETEKQEFKEVSSTAKPIACSSPDRQPAFAATGQVARDRSQYVHSVLNPVENLSQWKDVKAKTQTLKHPNKENINVEQGSEIPFSSQPSSFKVPKSLETFNSTPSPNIHTKREVTVDASLSNWLPSSETTPVGGSKGNSSCRTNSPVSLDDRPILGALTIEDLKKHSVSSSSPRRSPSPSPDEIPILGTVGSYWSCTGGDTDSGSSQKSTFDSKGIPNTTSKYKEDRRVNWHSTPFQVRLERALNRGDAEAYASCPPGGC